MKKPHRLKFRSPSEKEVAHMFNEELEDRITNACQREMTIETALFDKKDWIVNNIARIIAIEKLKQLDEWHRAGRKTNQFSRDIQDLIMEKAKYEAQIMTKTNYETIK